MGTRLSASITDIIARRRVDGSDGDHSAFVTNRIPIWYRPNPEDYAVESVP
jgi:hypothetical protein